MSRHDSWCFRTLAIALPRRVHSLDRSAYSILELMIALSLLSILLVLGWSLMQSFQDAETRSWKLSQRIRVLRTIRAWLADDMDHLVRSTASTPPVQSSSSPGQRSITNPSPTNAGLNSWLHHGNTSQAVFEKFDGDATGFVATISPSLDPIRFFDRMMTSTDSAESPSQEWPSVDALLDSEAEFAVREARESLWPQRSVDVEYRLEPVSRIQGKSSTAIQELQDIQFELVRREWLPSQAATATSLPNSSDRKLTTADLYRGAEPSEETTTPPLKESRLYGMVQAQFFYFDGTLWSQEWDSLVRGGMPKAVAITFDFPVRSDFVRPDKSWDIDFEDSVPQTIVLDPGSQDATVNPAKDRLVESSESGVVIIVETGNRSTTPSLSQPVGTLSR